MEIKLTDRQKIFLEGVLRSSIFLIVARELSYFMLICAMSPIFAIVEFCGKFFSCFGNSPYQGSDDGISVYALVLIFFVSFIYTTYLIAKLCGIHKYLSQFKFWKSFIILIVISVLTYYFIILNLHSFKLNYEETGNTYVTIALLPSYIVFLFFDFLTKKFPTPFRQIGYFFSNQFYIDLFKKIQKKCKKD